MSLAGFLNQTITVYTKSSYNAYGREVVGSGTDYPALVQPTTKQRLLPDSSLITIDAIAYIEPTTPVEVDDRVAFSSIQYKIHGKYTAVDGAGKTDHIKLELIKWRQT